MEKRRDCLASTEMGRSVIQKKKKNTNQQINKKQLKIGLPCTWAELVLNNLTTVFTTMHHSKFIAEKSKDAAPAKKEVNS